MPPPVHPSREKRPKPKARTRAEMDFEDFKAGEKAREALRKLVWAAKLGDIDLVRKQLAAGVDPKQTALSLGGLPAADWLPPDRDTALIVAAFEGQLACVELLLPLSDPMAKDNSGYDALMCAAMEGQLACVELLLPASDPLAKSEAGLTALHLAAKHGKLDCVRALFPVSDPLARDGKGLAPIDHALARGNQELAEELRRLVAEWEARRIGAEIPQAPQAGAPGARRI